MRSQRAALATLATLILAMAAEPPTTGWLYIDRNNGSFIFPFTATQCESFDIYYNSTVEHIFHFYDSTTPDPLSTLLTFRILPGVGYVEWICNIPSGFAFFHTNLGEYVVKPGTTTACLRDITTAYPLLTYSTAEFASYTRTISLPTTTVPANTLSTASFPTGAFSTATLNPILAVVTLTASSSSLSASSPPTSTTSPLSSLPPSAPSITTRLSSSPTVTSSQTRLKPRGSAVAGGVVGAVALVLFALIFLFWRKRRKPVPEMVPFPISPQPTDASGLPTSQLRSRDPPSPSQFPPGRVSDAEFLGNTPRYPYSPPDSSSQRNKPLPDVVVPLTGNPAVDSITAGNVLSPALPIALQPSLGEPGAPQQTSHYSALVSQGPSLDLTSLAPSTGDQQSPYTQSPYTQSLDTPSKAPETLLPDAVSLSQQSSTSETSERPLNLTTVLEVISHAQLSLRERQIVASVNNLLIQAPSPSSDSTRRDTMSSPPPYNP